jgi:hypothetical protein
MPRTASASRVCEPAFSPRERATLLRLQEGFLRYFLDNQTGDGLVLDRQANFGRRRSVGLCSTATTGMGFIAIALASAEPYHRLTRSEAIQRIRGGLETALEKLPHTHGILPHFVHSDTLAVTGADARSTVDTGWLAAGTLWAAEFLRDDRLTQLAERLYERIDWRWWTAPGGLIGHGADGGGQILPSCWDRLNGETVALYVLAAGSREDRCWLAANWNRLGRFFGQAGGLRFGSADLGLFVFQYGLDLLDLAGEPLPGNDLGADAARAAEANARVCQGASDRFRTYRRFWGLSAGDGPASGTAGYVYRPYSPAEPLDGTAHVTATIASLAHSPSRVWENVFQAERDSPRMRGRYGFGNVNLDCDWVGKEMVGIDAGAAALALDNCLFTSRIRRVFHRVAVVRRGLDRIAGAGRRAAAAA